MQHHDRTQRLLLAAIAACTFAFAQGPLATRADTNSHDGGSVRIDVTKLGITTHPTNATALYRGEMNSYWDGAIALPFCDGLVKRIVGLGPFADGTNIFIRSCRQTSDVGTLAVSYTDPGLTSGVIMDSTQYVDLDGIEGPWTDRAQPEPRADACFRVRVAIETSVLFHPDTLTYDRAIVRIGGGYPQPGCTNAQNPYPRGDVSVAFGAYVRGANFADLAKAAFTAAHADPSVPLGKALDVYAPTVRALRSQFRLRTYFGIGGTMIFAFSNGRDRLEYGSKFETPTSPKPTPTGKHNAIH